MTHSSFPASPGNNANKQSFQPFPKGFCWKFCKAKNVLAATSNMNVSNVRQPTRIFDVVGQNHLPQHHAPPRHIPLPPPIKISQLEFYLDGYPPALKRYLLDGFVRGFSLIMLDVTRRPPAIIYEKLSKELHLSRIAGPFSSLRLLPLGLTSKKVPGEFRLIHHLSFPYRTSVNSHIPMEASSKRYASINDAIRIIRHTGRGCALAKRDVKNAFQLIPVNPNDYDLLGIPWQDQFYYKCLPMGCSSSCKIFEAFSSSLDWIARYKLSIPGILHILDDFLIIERDTVTCSTELCRSLTVGVR